MRYSALAIPGAVISVPDCDLLNPVANGECGAWSDQNFGTAAGDDPQRPGCTGRLQRPVPQLAGLAHVSARADAGSRAERRLFPHAGTAVQLVTNNEAVPASGYDTYCITAPTDSRLPGGGGNRICGLYDVKPAFFGRVDNLVTQASNFGDGQKQVYNGVDLHPERTLCRRRTVLRRIERRPDGHRQLLHQRQPVADVAGVSQRRRVAGGDAGTEKLGVLQGDAPLVLEHAGEVPGGVSAAVGHRDQRHFPEQPGGSDHGELRDHQPAGQRTRSAATWRRARQPARLQRDGEHRADSTEHHVRAAAHAGGHAGVAAVPPARHDAGARAVWTSTTSSTRAACSPWFRPTGRRGRTPPRC